MNRDDIERMAREAKGHAYTNRYTPGETAFAFSIDRLEHFAALVAEAERDVILQILRNEWFKTQADLEAAIQVREQQTRNKHV